MSDYKDMMFIYKEQIAIKDFYLICILKIGSSIRHEEAALGIGKLCNFYSTTQDIYHF